jgi:ABC-type uncharacterized transport system ATPase subunit
MIKATVFETNTVRTPLQLYYQIHKKTVFYIQHCKLAIKAKKKLDDILHGFILSLGKHFCNNDQSDYTRKEEQLYWNGYYV